MESPATSDKTEGPSYAKASTSAKATADKTEGCFHSAAAEWTQASRDPEVAARNLRD